MSLNKINRTVTLENGFYIVRGIGPGGYYARQLWAVRGMKWDKARQGHAAPADELVCRALELMGYAPPPCPAVAEEVPTATAASLRQSLRIPAHIFEKMRPYQVEGTRLIQRWDGRILVGDEMGVGKTLQVLAWLSARPDALPAVLICPNNAKWAWVDEIEKWSLPWRVAMCSGLAGENMTIVRGDLGTPQFTIINYDILAARSKKAGWVDALRQQSPNTIVMDECHVLRNKDAKRTAAAEELVKEAPHIIGMTGSPIINEVMDVFTVLKMLRPKQFKSRWKFGMKYCNPVFNERACKMEFEGCTDPKGLYELLRKTVLLRRTKADVLKDLPPKQRQHVPLEISGPWAQEYTDVEKGVGDGSVDAFTALGKLRQYAALAKLDSGHAWVNEFLQTGEKLVLLCHHRQVGDWFLEAFNDCAVPYHGGMDDAQKRYSISQFEKDADIRLFVGSITACGVAINGLQTSCSNVAVLELPWSPAILQQAEDRVHRMGQKSSVNVWYLMARNTVDVDSMEVIVGKSGLAGAVLDNTLSERNAISRVLMNLRKRIR